jgi:hypothetical protein
MKKIMFVLFSASLSFAVISASAQDQTPNQDSTSTPGYAQGTQDKVKIKQNELPQAIRDAIINDKNKEYAGWQIGDAYRMSKDNTYSVQLKKGTEARTVKFDARGNKIEE